MNVSFSLGALAKTKWYEYLVRFAFGGAITVTAGILAKHFGPVFGGLFLAFPAIFPASATLVAKHETQKKQNAGIATSSRARQAAAVDSRSGIGKRWPGCFRANRLEAPSLLQFCFRVSCSKSGLARAGHPHLAHLEKTPLSLAIFLESSHPLFDPPFRLFRPFRPQYPIFLVA
jgi:uncharacterized protein DUF3147